MYSTAVRTQKHQLKNYIFFFGFLSVNKQDSEAKHFKLTSDVIMKYSPLWEGVNVLGKYGNKQFVKVWK